MQTRTHTAVHSHTIWSPMCTNTHIQPHSLILTCMHSFNHAKYKQTQYYNVKHRFWGLMCWRQRKLIARCCGDTKNLLPIPRAWLGVALAKRGSVSGIGVGSPGGRGGTRLRGVSRTGLITPCGLGCWRQAVVSWLLRGLGCVVLRRKCSRRVLGGSLGSRRL